jgi:hypothetical protein
MSKNSELNKVIAETEIGNNDVGHSKMLGESEVDVNTLTSEELKLALVISQNQIAQMKSELEKIKASPKSDSNSIEQLASIIANAITNKPTGPVDEDNINRTAEFRERAARIDGTSLMEAQSTMLAYRSESKIPVNVPKSFQSQFGATLDITVNGVRVSIPCDGKTYFINETHAIHAKERIAKVDRLLADTTPQITEIEA